MNQIDSIKKKQYNIFLAYVCHIFNSISFVIQQITKKPDKWRITHKRLTIRIRKLICGFGVLENWSDSGFGV